MGDTGATPLSTVNGDLCFAECGVTATVEGINIVEVIGQTSEPLSSLIWLCAITSK